MPYLQFVLLTRYKSTKKQKVVFALGQTRHNKACQAKYGRLFDIDAELLGYELHNPRRQHTVLRLQSHRLKLFPVRAAPTHQHLYTYTGGIGQLLFTHCFHCFCFLCSYVFMSEIFRILQGSPPDLSCGASGQAWPSAPAAVRGGWSVPAVAGPRGSRGTRC